MVGLSIPFVLSLGPMGVYCGGNWPEGGGQGRVGLPLWVVGSIQEGSAVLGGLMDMPNRIRKLCNNGLDIDSQNGRCLPG